MVTIAEASSPEDFDDVRTLLREYFAWTLEFFEGRGGAPTFEGIEEELATMPGPYSRPGGRILLARVDFAPAGCVALKPHGEGEGELKRLYVRPALRGMKIGRRLVTTLLDEARGIGYRRVVLDSHRKMFSAHAIYRGAGFEEIPAPADFPAALTPIVLFMELTLPG